MAFPDVRAGIHANLRAYTGVKNIIGGMPTNIHTTPAWVTQFESGTRIGQTKNFFWRFRLHAIMDHQVNDLAETEIDTMIPLACTAFSSKLDDSSGHPRATLGGVARVCWFEDVRSGDTDGYMTFGSGDSAKVYRHISFVLVIETTEAY